ncbi:hypothetical protein EXN51_15440 [Agrobacterium fabrum]|uniref:Uncharacterized protein n=1 Tax=Agrobacterium fabrum (strain C58 / ATCC 33970) TaxID=176299 RepID=Q8UKA6_AGRFC|nr:hypothetical protein Atu5217 [Agrobacterium fabrum str. C58]TRB28061.1 hypothetical protein EXN51_15440 [Agrobacterium fabrum]
MVSIRPARRRSVPTSGSCVAAPSPSCTARWPRQVGIVVTQGLANLTALAGNLADETKIFLEIGKREEADKVAHAIVE